MQANVLALWSKCQTFVGRVCADRDASHGLQHMQSVTELAMLTHSLQGPSSVVDHNKTALRVVAVAMLHDVNDHKYDKDGTLSSVVEDFVKEISEENSTALDATQVLGAVNAISYSKEKKNGMRWFEGHLQPDWVYIRDIVSDADKLTAIGVEGLERCAQYNAHKKGSLDPAELLRDVVTHADEKLLRLKDEFIVTKTGKFLAEHRHAEMVELLKAWQKNGLPPHTYCD